VPNPYYLVYNGAATMAGAEAVFLDATRDNRFMPDLAAIPRETLERTALFYLCSPANPQGTVATLDYLKQAIALAREYDFVLAVDECYAEIYDRTPPAGALEACATLGDGFDNVVVFHSLSKRSSAAGLRSGFVAGDPKLIGHYSHLRSYGGCQVPLPVQAAAAALWQDEAHVEENRANTAANSTSPRRHWRAATGSTGRRAGSFCGWKSATASRRPCGCGATRRSGFCRAAIPRGRRRAGRTRARLTSGWRSCMTRRPSPPPLNEFAGCCRKIGLSDA
jgi:aspartate/methionine/tyrosine aminotransferase